MNLCARVLKSRGMNGGNLRLFTIALFSNSIVMVDQPRRRHRMVARLTILSRCYRKIALRSTNTEIKTNIQPQIKKLLLHRNDISQAKDMSLTIIPMNENTPDIFQQGKSAIMNLRVHTTRTSKRVRARPLGWKLDLRPEAVVLR